MSNRRSIIEEILEVKSRRKSDIPQGELFIRLMQVEQAYRKRNDLDHELLRYFPITVVGCIESYYRLAIKALIDSGEPYLSSSRALFPKFNIGFDVLHALHGQSVTIGDVIAHSLSISNLTHVSSHMDNLLDIDYLKALATVRDRWAVEIHGAEDQPILEKPDATFRWVARAFELRHIFCHELATDHQIPTSEMENAFEHSLLFLKASEEFVSETMHPNAPLTQLDMNIASAEEYRQERDKLDTLMAQLKSMVKGKQAQMLNEANAAWTQSLAASVSIEGLTYEGGSIRPLIENSAKTRLTRDRAKQIEELIQIVKIR